MWQEGHQPRSAALELQYAPTAGSPPHAAIDPINIKVPALFDRKCGKKALVTPRGP
jgi:hypothetical protein